MSRRTGARCGAFFCVESTGCSALTRQCVFALLYVLKQCAGARLRLAGFSSGTGVGARGGCSARRCGSIAGVRNLSGFASLRHLPFQGRLLARVYRNLGKRHKLSPMKGEVSPQATEGLSCSHAASCVRISPTMRFYWNVLCSSHACCLPHATNRTACGRLRFCSARVEIAGSAFS